ncbi:MAG: single-stranded DNA-binding protein [Streptosporangiaceae bacterium]
MSAIPVTVIGNLTADPELRFTGSGAAVATFTIASNERYKDSSGQWQDGPVSFVRCNAWRELAEHVAESLAKGDRAIVTGTLRQRNYETTQGEKRTVWEVSVAEAGAALHYATVKISKVRRDSVPAPEDPWAGAPAPNPPEDEPPF